MSDLPTTDLPTTNLPFEELPPNHFAFARMGAEGDTKHMWDVNNPVQVEAARKLFEELRGQGYMAFRVVSYEKDGKRFVKKGETMPDFDASAGRMRLVPPANAEEVPPFKGEPAESFDPSASHVMVPPMKGG